MQARHIRYPTIDPVSSTSEQSEGACAARGTHAAVIDPVLPLLSQSWQRERLVLGENGNFAPQAGRRHAEMVAVDLVHSSEPSLTRIGQSRITIAYDARMSQPARAALIASAAHGGWPIAADTESLALLTLAERIAASEIPVLHEIDRHGATQGTSKYENPIRCEATLGHQMGKTRPRIEVHARLARSAVAESVATVIEKQHAGSQGNELRCVGKTVRSVARVAV